MNKKQSLKSSRIDIFILLCSLFEYDAMIQPPAKKTDARPSREEIGFLASGKDIVKTNLGNLAANESLLKNNARLGFRIARTLTFRRPETKGKSL